MTASPSILAPFVPTHPDVAERMLDLAGVGSGDVIYDLGCGDGQLVVAAAKRGARAVGIEIEPVLLELARERAARAGVADLVHLELGDASECACAEATVVLLYLVEWSTERMLERLAIGLRPGTRIVSNRFASAVWPPREIALCKEADGSTRPLYLWITDGQGVSAARPGHRSRLAEVPRVAGGLRAEHFEPHLESDLVVASCDVSLRLRAIDHSPQVPALGLPAPFSLFLSGPPQPRLEQGTYLLDHVELGRLELFLVPIGRPDGAETRYQVAFG